MSQQLIEVIPLIPWLSHLWSDYALKRVGMLCRRHRRLDGGVWSDKYPTEARSLPPTEVDLASSPYPDIIRAETNYHHSGAWPPSVAGLACTLHVFGVRCQHCSFRRPPHGWRLS